VHCPTQCVELVAGHVNQSKKRCDLTDIRENKNGSRNAEIANVPGRPRNACKKKRIWKGSIVLRLRTHPCGALQLTEDFRPLRPAMCTSGAATKTWASEERKARAGERTAFNTQEQGKERKVWPRRKTCTYHKLLPTNHPTRVGHPATSVRASRQK